MLWFFIFLLGKEMKKHRSDIPLPLTQLNGFNFSIGSFNIHFLISAFTHNISQETLNRFCCCSFNENYQRLLCDDDLYLIHRHPRQIFFIIQRLFRYFKGIFNKKNCCQTCVLIWTISLNWILCYLMLLYRPLQQNST